MHTASPESPQLSMRGACDRCRMLKLKCCTIGVSECCVRCTKARITCVFGRRARAKRRRNSEYASSADTASQVEDNDAAIRPSPGAHSIRSPESGSPRALGPFTPLSMFSCPMVPTDVLYPLRSADGLDAEADLVLGSDALFFDHESYDPAMMWSKPDADNAVSVETTDDAYTGMHSSVPATHNQTVAGSSAADVPASERIRAEEPRMSDFTQAGSAQQWAVAKIIETQLNSFGSDNDELLGLVTKIQQQLSRLENGPWRKDGTKSLNDYPVGGIIQLARKLGEVAEGIFGHRERTITDSVDHGSNTASVDSAQADTPSVLLLLCGYTWLLRLYNVVLDHFQSHVDHIPIHHSQSAEVATAWNPHSIVSPPFDPELTLGEFPCVTSILEMHRIYAAIRTLCDALRSVECRLGSGGIELRETAMATLQNWDYKYSRNLKMEPSATHTHTVILLHGLGSTGERFGREFLETAISSSGRTLPALLPHARFVFPTSRRRRSTAFGRSLLTQWFNLTRTEDPSYLADRQLQGLAESASEILAVIGDELGRVPARNLLLGGLSQGCAMALAVLLCLDHPIGGFIGMSGFFTFEAGIKMVLVEEDLDELDPFSDAGENRTAREMPVRAQEYERELLSLDPLDNLSSERTAHRTPVLLGHGAEDEKVPVHLGEAAAGVMRAAGYDVEWKIYKNQGHWYKIPDQIDDIVSFISRLGWKVEVDGSRV
ncbi:acyl-protein thioesterase 1,2, putative [Cordyceps militaris CM01]|uniref:Acyl-protein thioesterase 1,2, putative n=1 Tax=Cordyceps militaris (strain CM01) TaxID=983644 RepID=G3JML7_CORMM|nr:acyl-protein thioesterase 1,2, putative [Cordyceps militaris CM01]EGX90053.1 acyl-protein thioesterase 1,2, putative [Cordyceps militaris CM01]